MEVDDNGVQSLAKKIGFIILINQGNGVIQSARNLLYSNFESTREEIFNLIAITALGEKPSGNQSIFFSFSPVILALSLLTIYLIIQRKSSKDHKTDSC